MVTTSVLIPSKYAQIDWFDCHWWKIWPNNIFPNVGVSIWNQLLYFWDFPPNLCLFSCEILYSLTSLGLKELFKLNNRKKTLLHIKGSQTKSVGNHWPNTPQWDSFRKKKKAIYGNKKNPFSGLERFLWAISPKSNKDWELKEYEGVSPGTPCEE